jgi:hypothetical protein
LRGRTLPEALGSAVQTFPSEFVVTFKQFGIEFHSSFTQLSSGSVDSPDIYVMNEISGKPVKYVIENNENDTVLNNMIFSVKLKKKSRFTNVVHTLDKL